jgi:hypothetical protein
VCNEHAPVCLTPPAPQAGLRAMLLAHRGASTLQNHRHRGSAQWYEGVIGFFNPLQWTHAVHYDDGDCEVLALWAPGQLVRRLPPQLHTPPKTLHPGGPLGRATVHIYIYIYIYICTPQRLLVFILPSASGPGCTVLFVDLPRLSWWRRLHPPRRVGGRPQHRRLVMPLRCSGHPCRGVRRLPPLQPPHPLRKVSQLMWRTCRRRLSAGCSQAKIAEFRSRRGIA